MFSNFSLSLSLSLSIKKRAVYENVERCTAPQSAEYITRRMRFACWITNGTHSLSSLSLSLSLLKYLMLIAFPQQQWFRERASMLRHTYIVCLIEC
jgi:hypothetical protein